MKGDKEIEARLDRADQHRQRKPGLDLWEASAPPQEVEAFYSYLRVWLKKRESGTVIGWKIFAALCREDIPSFELREQALAGTLRERIQRL